MKKDVPKEVADAIALAHQINPTVGRNVEGMITMLWGDPAAINKAAMAWTNASNAAHNSSQALADEVIRITNEHWKGPAAGAYSSWMQSLQRHSIDNLGWCFWKIGDILAGVAEDVGEMNKYISMACTDFVTVVGAVLLKGKVGTGVKGTAALTALITAAGDLVRRLYDFESSYDQKLAPRTQALSREVDSISDPSKPDTCRIGLFKMQSSAIDAPSLNIHIFADSYHYNLIGYWDRWE
jgi:uncharacterized protein YukE